jgi:hypothetical protein
VCRECPARRAGDLVVVALASTAPKGFVRPHGSSPWAEGPPSRHTLKGRQDGAAVAASRQQLVDLKTQAATGTIDPAFLDEAEALAPPCLARCWARRGAELRIEAPVQAKKQALPGAFDPVPHGSSPWAEDPRRLLVHTSPGKRSTDFVARLDQLGAAYGTAERAPPLVVVLDNGPIHRSKPTRGHGHIGLKTRPNPNTVHFG